MNLIFEIARALPGAFVTGSVAAFLAVTFPDVASQTVAFLCGFAAWCGFFAFLTHLHYKPKMDADSSPHTRLQSDDATIVTTKLSNGNEVKLLNSATSKIALITANSIDFSDPKLRNLDANRAQKSETSP